MPREPLLDTLTGARLAGVRLELLARLAFPRGAGERMGVSGGCEYEGPAVPHAAMGIWPRPPAYPGESSSSSTQSDSSPMLSDCLPEKTSRMPCPSTGGEIASTSIAEYAWRVCQPGGSKPHDFFQLDRPSELRYPPLPLGLANGVWRLCAAKAVGVCARRGVSSSERRTCGLCGELFRLLSLSDRSYDEPGCEEPRDCADPCTLR